MGPLVIKERFKETKFIAVGTREAWCDKGHKEGTTNHFVQNPSVKRKKSYTDPRACWTHTNEEEESQHSLIFQVPEAAERKREDARSRGGSGGRGAGGRE